MYLKQSYISHTQPEWTNLGKFSQFLLNCLKEIKKKMNQILFNPMQYQTERGFFFFFCETFSHLLAAPVAEEAGGLYDSQPD